MKKHILTFGLLAICAISNAQKATITWGEISKKESLFEQMIAGSDGDIIKLSSEVKGGGFSLFGIGGGATYTPMLTKYNNKFNEVKSNTFPADEKGTRMNGFLRVNNLIYLMGNRYDKETKSTAYFAQPINVNTLNTEGGLVNFGSFEARKGGFFSGVSESSVKFVGSKDSSKLLVFALTPYNKKENEKYYMSVFDSKTMKKIWEKTVELPYLDKVVYMYDFFVTNQGEVGVLFKHYDQEVKKESVKVDGARVPSYKTKLIIYNSTSTKPVEMIFNLNDKFVHDIDLTTDASDNLTLFGTYKIKESGHVNGYFISTVDRKTNAVTLKKMDAFPQELIELLDEDDQGSKKEKDPGLQTYFRLKYTGMRDNGSLDYVLEYYRMVEHTTQNTRGYSTTYYTYEYGDIIVINVTGAGKSTFVRIPKLQFSRDFTAASGFVALPYKNKLVFFYNDDKDNVTRDLTKKPEKCTRFGKSTFVMTTVEENGSFAREALFSNGDLSVTTCTNYCGLLAKNKISLYASKIDALSAAKDMLGSLELK